MFFFPDSSSGLHFRIENDLFVCTVSPECAAMSFRNLTILKAHFAKFHSQLSEEQVAIEPDVCDLKEREGLKECSILVEKMTERDLEQFQSVRDKVVKEEIVEEDGDDDEAMETNDEQTSFGAIEKEEISDNFVAVGDSNEEEGHDDDDDDKDHLGEAADNEDDDDDDVPLSQMRKNVVRKMDVGPVGDDGKVDCNICQKRLQPVRNYFFVRSIEG